MVVAYNNKFLRTLGQTRVYDNYPNMSYYFVHFKFYKSISFIWKSFYG